MPIQLNYTDPDTGFNAPVSYWVIKKPAIDLELNTVQYDLLGYISLAAKNASKQPQKTQTVSATFAQLGITGNSTLVQTLAALYTFALTYVNPLTGTVFFQGGTIV